MFTWLMSLWKKSWQRRQVGEGPAVQQARVLIPPVLTWLPSRRQIVADGYAWLRTRRIPWRPFVEIGWLGLWAMWVGRAYLDFNPYSWPMGGEMGVQLQTHHMWVWLQQCGLCALWNGNINGGSPALADAFGSMVHPLVIVTTLVWGVMVGAKVSLVVALWLGGLAQWWIARTLKLGRAACLWSASLAIVGGHLTGRMENSNFGLVLSTATCSLALAAALDLAMTGRRRAALGLAAIGAMAIASGQGYMELGLLAWAPALLCFLLDSSFRVRPVWREYALAVCLSLLIAGVFLVPMFHFGSQTYKDVDLQFQTVQPLEYMPLNLVIRDTDFMRTQVLGKMAYPYMYNVYIGWVPVLLAALCLRWARRADYRPVLFLAVGAALMFLMASAIPLRWAVKVIPSLAGFRYSAIIAGLAVPAILGLAALSLDRLLSLDWPRIALVLGPGGRNVGSLNTAWILIVPLVWSLYTAYDLAQTWLGTRDMFPVYAALDSLSTPSLQWVALPFGEHYWIEPALVRNLKLTSVVWAWKWKDRELPRPHLIANRPGPPPESILVGELHDVPLYHVLGVEYAYVELAGRTVPCQSAGGGGDLVVKCSTDEPGHLWVQENAWNGWYAWRDQQPVPLAGARWLSVQAPAGQHEYRFRYLPWDAGLGLLLTLAGIASTLWLWLHSSPALGTTASALPDTSRLVRQHETV